MENLKKSDQEIYNLIKEEEKEQFSRIRLIASENYVSSAILEANGSILTNRYTEGYVGNRYYEGQEIIDQIESLAIERAKKLFKMNFANVQILSGSPANLAIYLACLNDNDKIMGLHLFDGGHLSHGWKVSFTGKLFTSVLYRLDPETHLLDYSKIREIAKKEKPKLIIAGFSSYPQQVDFKAFHDIAKEVDALLLADISHISALIIGDIHPDPSPYADIIMSTTHKSLRGPRGAIILSKNENIAKSIDRAVFPGLQGGSHNHHVAAKAICFKEALSKDFKIYAQQIQKNAKKLAEELLKKDFELITGGTETHLMLINLMNKNIEGKIFAKLLNRCGIICNANSIPYDPKPSFNPSGIRLGTPAVTTLGMKENDMEVIANWINEVLENRNNENKLESIKQEVCEFSQKFSNDKFIIS